MWPRVVEVMLGCWLAVSPFIFPLSTRARWEWVNDFACAALMILLALASYARRTRWAHWLQILVALWLLGSSYFGSAVPPSAAMQNRFVLGLLLGMLAIIPNHATQPPRDWRRFETGSDRPLRI